jgi:hypothetical protein
MFFELQETGCASECSTVFCSPHASGTPKVPGHLLLSSLQGCKARSRLHDTTQELMRLHSQAAGAWQRPGTSDGLAQTATSAADALDPSRGPTTSRFEPQSGARVSEDGRGEAPSISDSAAADSASDVERSCGVVPAVYVGNLFMVSSLDRCGRPDRPAVRPCSVRELRF